MSISKALPADLSAKTFGDEIVKILNQYGFGILSKSDLESVLLYAMERASKQFADADSYRRAEMLRITDQKYRTLSRRVGMWLDQDNAKKTDKDLFEEFLKDALRVYQEAPQEKEVRVVVDDEMHRRNIQKALERASKEGSQIAVEISLTVMDPKFRTTG